MIDHSFLSCFFDELPEDPRNYFIQVRKHDNDDDDDDNNNDDTTTNDIVKPYI